MMVKWVVGIVAIGLLAAKNGKADQVTYTYDEAQRLTRVTYASGASIAYTYDAAGNLLSRTVTAPGSGSSAPKTAKNVSSSRRGAGKEKSSKRPQLRQ